MSSTVRIPWSHDLDNVRRWDEVCAWAIEYFGLPGDRFQTYANVNHMDFVFESNKDALLMAIQWNARIVPNDELTVDLVGKYIN